MADDAHVDAVCQLDRRTSMKTQDCCLGDLGSKAAVVLLPGCPRQFEL